MRLGLGVVLLAVSALAAGCGGSDEGGGSGSTSAPASTATATAPAVEDQVRVAAERVFATEDADELCGPLVTAHFVDEVFKGDQQLCVKAQRKSLAEDDDDGTTKVTGVEVSGPQAIVAAEVVGGNAAGVTGHLAFAREGDAWKLDGYEIDYLRNALVKSMEFAGQDDGTGMFTEPSLQRCIIADTKAMPDADLREYMYFFLRQDRKHAMAVANKQAAGCPEQLVTYVANLITDALSEDGKRSPAFIKCARREFTALLGLTGLAKNGLKGNVNDAVSAAYQALASQVNKTCTKEEKAAQGA